MHRCFRLDPPFSVSVFVGSLGNWQSWLLATNGRLIRSNGELLKPQGTDMGNLKSYHSFGKKGKTTAHLPKIPVGILVSGVIFSVFCQGCRLPMSKFRASQNASLGRSCPDFLTIVKWFFGAQVFIGLSPFPVIVTTCAPWQMCCRWCLSPSSSDYYWEGGQPKVYS